MSPRAALVAMALLSACSAGGPGPDMFDLTGDAPGDSDAGAAGAPTESEATVYPPEPGACLCRRETRKTWFRRVPGDATGSFSWEERGFDNRTVTGWANRWACSRYTSASTDDGETVAWTQGAGECLDPDEPAPPDVVHSDPDGILDGALERWHAVLGVELDDIPSFTAAIVTEVECVGVPGAIGCASAPDANGVRHITMSDLLFGDGLLAVSTHELGHVLGFKGHSSTGIMSERVSVVAQVDTASAEPICEAGLVPCRWFEPESE